MYIEKNNEPGVTHSDYLSLPSLHLLLAHQGNNHKNTYIINYLLHDDNYCKKNNQINHSTGVRVVDVCMHACMQICVDTG